MCKTKTLRILLEYEFLSHVVSYFVNNLLLQILRATFVFCLAPVIHSGIVALPDLTKSSNNI